MYSCAKENNLDFMIPKKLVDYVRVKNNIIILKKELPEELENDLEKFRKDYEVARLILKFVDRYDSSMTDEEK